MAEGLRTIEVEVAVDRSGHREAAGWGLRTITRTITIEVEAAASLENPPAGKWPKACAAWKSAQKRRSKKAHQAKDGCA